MPQITKGLVLSLLTDHPTPRLAPQPASGGRGAARQRARSHRARRTPPLAGRYIGYVLYFVGAGLISGAVVHHPLDPARYTVVGVIGVFVFLLATLVNEFLLASDRPALPRALMVIGASLLLSFGIGMLSGGLQHFDDFPARGAVLVPLGIAVSFVAFVLKDADASWRRIFGPMGLAVLLIAAGAYFGLNVIADGMAAETSGGGHSHGGGAEDPADRGIGSESPASPGGATAPKEPAAPSRGGAAEADDGHAH